MPRKRTRRPRGPRNKISPGEVIGNRNIFATVKAGSTLTCNASEVNFPKDRPVRVTHITGTATVLKGQCGLMEVVLYNQGLTQLASTGVQSVSLAGRTFTVRAPKRSDMWIDPGNALTTQLKIFHADFPCVSQLMKDSVILFNMIVHYVAGKEQITDVCPTLRILGEDQPSTSTLVPLR